MDFRYDPYLALYLPLYELGGSSFMSKDKHGHLCTVTGAVWRPNGRYFDGDDYINCKSNAVLFPANFSVELFFSNIGTGGQDFPLSCGSKQYGYKMQVYAGTTLKWSIGDGINDYQNAITKTIVVGEFYHAIGTYEEGVGSKLFVNADYVGANSTFTGTIVYDSSDPSLVLGKLRAGYTGLFFSGVVDEVRIYSRVLTPIEIQHNYLATKWRYR